MVQQTIHISFPLRKAAQIYRDWKKEENKLLVMRKKKIAGKQTCSQYTYIRRALSLLPSDQLPIVLKRLFEIYRAFCAINFDFQFISWKVFAYLILRNIKGQNPFFIWDIVLNILPWYRYISIYLSLIMYCKVLLFDEKKKYCVEDKKIMPLLVGYVRPNFQHINLVLSKSV